MINLELVNGDRAVAKLDALPDRVRSELKIGIGRSALKLVRAVQQDKLSGQVLKVRTGRLRRSITDAIEESTTSVSGVVSTPVVYAPRQEYGFKGTETVREHLREIKQAFGIPIAPRQVTVQQHSRKVDYPAHSFLRTALADLQASGVIQTEIDAALARAVK